VCLFTRGRLPIPVPAGNTKTQFLYIDDLMNIFDHLMYKDRCVGQAFNVTNPEMISWHQWAENAMDALGKHVPVKAVPYIGKMNPREFFPFRDCTYLLGIKKLIDYQIPLPSTTWRKGWNLTYRYQKQNPTYCCDPKMNRVEEALSL
jgi:nucleoside-diphosphate-sugar epimerase